MKRVIYADQIRESTEGMGVTIEGVLLKDGAMSNVSGVSTYSKTLTLAAGSNVGIETTVTREPFSVLILDVTGKPITDEVYVESMTKVGTYYQFSVYSTNEIVDVKLKILY